jgi:hypothetical protein
MSLLRFHRSVQSPCHVQVSISLCDVLVALSSICVSHRTVVMGWDTHRKRQPFPSRSWLTPFYVFLSCWVKPTLIDDILVPINRPSGLGMWMYVRGQAWMRIWTKAHRLLAHAVSGTHSLHYFMELWKMLLHCLLLATLSQKINWSHLCKYWWLLLTWGYGLLGTAVSIHIPLTICPSFHLPILSSSMISYWAGVQVHSFPNSLQPLQRYSCVGALPSPGWCWEHCGAGEGMPEQGTQVGTGATRSSWPQCNPRPCSHSFLASCKSHSSSGQGWCGWSDI